MSAAYGTLGRSLPSLRRALGWWGRGTGISSSISSGGTSGGISSGAGGHGGVAVAAAGRACTLRARAYVSTAAAEPAPDAAPAPAPPAKAPTIFSSRAKIAPACPAWLKSSKARANIDKSFSLEEVYDADYSSVQIATPLSAAPPAAASAASSSSSSAAGGGGGAVPHKVVIKTFKKAKLLSRPDLQQKLKLEWDVHSELEHPNIIRAYLAAEDDSSVGIFMEYAGEQ